MDRTRLEMDRIYGSSDVLTVDGRDAPFRRDAKRSGRNIFRVVILGCAVLRPEPQESCI